MFFFNVKGEMYESRDLLTGEEERNFAKTICKNTAEYNKNHPGMYFVFTNSSEFEISAFAISRDRVIDTKQAAEFIESLGIKHPDEIEISETTLDEFLDIHEEAYQKIKK